MSRPRRVPAPPRTRAATASAAALLCALAAPALSGTLPLTEESRTLAAQEGGAADLDDLGKETYDRWCAGCHGVDGAGQGPGAAYMLPRPRDFTRAQYQIRTTASGQLPTDEDILRMIDEGMPGTAMPGWEDMLSRQEREALVDYLKSLSRFFQPGAQPDPLDFGSAPSANEERLERGAEVYEELECWQCHGQAGRGDGTSSPTLENDRGLPTYPADLTENWHFNGGGTVEEIYRRLRTGLDGTPMATFSDMVDAGLITDEDLWSLAHYVRSLSPEDRPVAREVIVAELTEGELPSDPDDAAWDEVERYYVPLVGQILLPPRWFAPRIDGLWVQALHDGASLAMRVSWTDPSESPDSAWADFAARVDSVMEPAEDAGWEHGAPDRLVVQFPQTPSEGLERPFFLQGDTRRPAYLWSWTSAEGAVEQNARGLGTAVDQEAATTQLEGAAIHADGQWRVVLRRSATTPDTAIDIQFATGSTVPVAFQAWDGDNAETGGRAAISTWYFVHLQQPTPLVAYLSPALALVLTGLLGIYLVRQAKRRAEHEGAPPGEPVGAAVAGD